MDLNMDISENDGDDIQMNFKIHECMICQKTLSNSANLNRHIRNVHKSIPVNPYERIVNCSECEFQANTLQILIQHLETDHGVQIERQKIQFPCEEEFMQWKTEVQKNTSSLYVKKGYGKRKDCREVTHYYCHRSGHFKSKSTGKKSLKVQGSNKINAFCPSRMTAIKFGDGHVEVEFVSTHVGHKIELGRLYLTREERKSIANKLYDGVPITTVVEEFRKTSGQERLHLLTRRDVLNIRREFKIKTDGILSPFGGRSKKVMKRRAQTKHITLDGEEEEEEKNGVVETATWCIQSNIGEPCLLVEKTFNKECINCLEGSGSCIHSYKCTCLDYTINSVTCEHINLVHGLNQANQVPVEQLTTEEPVNNTDHDYGVPTNEILPTAEFLCSKEMIAINAIREAQREELRVSLIQEIDNAILHVNTDEDCTVVKDYVKQSVAAFLATKNNQQDGDMHGVKCTLSSVDLLF